MKMTLLPALCILIISTNSHVLAKQQASCCQGALSAIRTPKLERATTLESPAIRGIDFSKEVPDNAPRVRRPSYIKSSDRRDSRKIGIGLILGGGALITAGTVIVYYGAQMHNYTSNGIYHRVYPEPYYILGVAIAGGGLGMLTRGIVKLCRD